MARSGSIPKSGYKLRYEFRDHGAERIFEVEGIDTREPDICISGLVLRGVKKPHDCTPARLSANSADRRLLRLSPQQKDLRKCPKVCKQMIL
jgi:hypothetical protein